MTGKRGIVLPFRRDQKRDVASGMGPKLLISKVKQVLLTDGDTPRSGGELPWRTAFGAGLSLLRHQTGGPVAEELARVYVRDALRRWLPNVEVTEMTLMVSGTRLTIRLRVQEKPSGDTATVEVNP